MDKKIVVVYEDGNYRISTYPSLNVVVTNDDVQVHELFAIFIGNLEIEKEIDNVE